MTGQQRSSRGVRHRASADRGAGQPGQRLAFVSLGSNIDPERNLLAAVARLARLASVEAVSKVYESDPVGPPGQPTFLNAAVLLRTELAAGPLRDRLLRRVERAMGRRRTPDRFAPRPIDLDLVLLDGEVSTGPPRLPDPDLLAHPHLAIPTAELAPAFLHPETGEPLSAIAARLAGATRDGLGGLRPRPDVDLAAVVAPSDRSRGGRPLPGDRVIR